MAMQVVGISDWKVARPPDTLITYALGSCVGICLLDASSGVAGLSHIMLPTKSVAPNDRNMMKFADTAIPDMLQKMEQLGARRARITAKIAGGAQMFDVQNTAANSSMWQIGQRNVDAVTKTLQALRIPIVAKDVLKNYGRTVSFDPANGIMTVRALNKGVVEL